MLILGLDPASRLFGWGLVEPAGMKFRRIASGVIVLKDSKYLMIATRVTEIIREHKPDIVAMEKPIVHSKNSKAGAIVLGQARGAALAALESCGLMVIDLMPSELKRLATGKGNADKAQVARWVQFQTGYHTDKEDESDALAAAIAGLLKRKERQILREGKR